MVLQSIRENEPRTRAIGYPGRALQDRGGDAVRAVRRARRRALRDQNQFAAPDFVFFLVSGEAVIFNVMGGIGTLVGPIVGAAFFLLLREELSRYFEYYLIPVGIIFIADGDLPAPGFPGVPPPPAQPVAAGPGS